MRDLVAVIWAPLLLCGPCAQGGCARFGYDETKAEVVDAGNQPKDAGEPLDAQPYEIFDASDPDASSEAPDAEAATPNWGILSPFRKPIVIPAEHVSGALERFPVLVALEGDDDLQDVALADGGDIRFTSSDGAPLPHEIELFDRSGGRLLAWVRVESLSSVADTTIYLYYGDERSVDEENRPQAVWDDNFIAVHHMGSALKDSTDNGYDLVDVSSAVSPVAVSETGGIIGMSALLVGDGAGPDGLAIDANHNGVEDPDVDGNGDDLDELDRAENMTVSAWVRMDGSLLDFEGVVGKNGSSDNEGWGISTSYAGYMGTDSLGVSMGVVGTSGAGDTTGPGEVPANSPFLCVVVFTGLAAVDDQLRIYINGQERDTTSYSVAGSMIPMRTPDTHHPVHIGSTTFQPSAGLHGAIDEVRLSKTNPSPDWIRTEYENQVNPTAFIEVKEREMR